MIILIDGEEIRQLFRRQQNLDILLDQKMLQFYKGSNCLHMTSKERVLAAIAHEEPDRVPVGEWEYGPEIARPVLGEECLWLGGLARYQALWEVWPAGPGAHVAPPTA